MTNQAREKGTLIRGLIFVGAILMIWFARPPSYADVSQSLQFQVQPQSVVWLNGNLPVSGGDMEIRLEPGRHEVAVATNVGFTLSTHDAVDHTAVQGLIVSSPAAGRAAQATGYYGPDASQTPLYTQSGPTAAVKGTPEDQSVSFTIEADTSVILVLALDER